MEHITRKKVNVQKYKCPHDTFPSWNNKVWILSIRL
jgi:hypothetical protein